MVPYYKKFCIFVIYFSSNTANDNASTYISHKQQYCNAMRKLLKPHTLAGSGSEAVAMTIASRQCVFRLMYICRYTSTLWPFIAHRDAKYGTVLNLWADEPMTSRMSKLFSSVVFEMGCREGLEALACQVLSMCSQTSPPPSLSILKGFAVWVKIWLVCRCSGSLLE
jgi:hypothetical protein